MFCIQPLTVIFAAEIFNLYSRPKAATMYAQTRNILARSYVVRGHAKDTTEMAALNGLTWNRIKFWLLQSSHPVKRWLLAWKDSFAIEARQLMAPLSNLYQNGWYKFPNRMERTQEASANFWFDSLLLLNKSVNGLHCTHWFIVMFLLLS